MGSSPLRTSPHHRWGAGLRVRSGRPGRAGYGDPVRHTRSLAAAGLVSLLALTACSGGSGGATSEQPPAQQLADARAVLEKSPAVTFTLESTGLPGKAVGVSGARGTGLFTPPSFQGTLNASIKGVTGTVEVVAVDQDVYMKFFTPTFNKIDPATYGAPNPAHVSATARQTAPSSSPSSRH